MIPVAFTLMLIGQIKQTVKRFGTTSEHGAAVQSSSTGTKKGKGHENDDSPTHMAL